VRLLKINANVFLTDHALVEADGLKGISARNIAAQMSCAVGSLYRNFDNLNAIILVVNLETLKCHVHEHVQADDASLKIRQMAMA